MTSERRFSQYSLLPHFPRPPRFEHRSPRPRPWRARALLLQVPCSPILLLSSLPWISAKYSLANGAIANACTKRTIPRNRQKATTKFTDSCRGSHSVSPNKGRYGISKSGATVGGGGCGGVARGAATLEGSQTPPLRQPCLPAQNAGFELFTL